MSKQLTHEDHESLIKYEGEHFYVFQVSAALFEVRKKCGTFSFAVGWSKDVEACIRTAKKLDKYPRKVQ